MKKYISKIGVVLLFLSVFACTEDITRNPLDTISEPLFFRNAADFELYCNNFYALLPQWNEGDNQSDITRGNGYNSVSNGTNQAPLSSRFWNSSYDKIRNVNFLLKKYDEFEDKKQVDRYSGEAKYFRAMVFFGLAKAYGGVPIVTRVLDIDSEELYQPRNTRKETFDFIIKDLEEAVAVLPSQNDITPDKQGRITKEGASALLARVCLFEGTWQKSRGKDGNALLKKSKDAAKLVIDSNAFELWRHPELGENWYAYLFTLDDVQNNKENLGKDSNKEFIVYKAFNLEFRNVPRGVFGDRVSNRLCPTKKLADMYLCTDGLPITKSNLFEGYDKVDTEYKNRDPRMNNLFMVPGKQYWKPGNGRDWSIPDAELGDPKTSNGFIHFAENVMGTVTSTGYAHRHCVPESNEKLFGYNYPVIRYSEVLLTYAEATYELDNSISDADLNISLNLVRARVDMPALTNDFVQQNGLSMQDEIRRERTIELAYESFRYDDLRRWYIAHIELKKPILGFTVIGTEWENKYTIKGKFDSDGVLIVEAADTRKFDKEKHYLHPLPINEIEKNDNLKQNPNW